MVLVYEDRIQVRKKVKKTVLPENRFGYDDNRCTLHTMLYRFVAFVRALYDPRVPRGQYVSACIHGCKVDICKREKTNHSRRIRGLCVFLREKEREREREKDKGSNSKEI